MISILREWEGKIEIDGKVCDVEDLKFEDGEQIDIRLIPDRSEK